MHVTNEELRVSNESLTKDNERVKEMQEHLQMLVLENESLKANNDIFRRASTDDNNRPLMEAANQIDTLKKENLRLTKSNEEQEINIKKAMTEFER